MKMAPKQQKKWNRRGKPLGSGTISNARRERRAAMFGQEAEEASPSDEAWQPAESSTAPRPWILATAPWKKGADDDDDDALPKAAEEETAAGAAPLQPPIPSKLVDAKLDSSHSSSDDWGAWKGTKHRKDASDESIQFAGNVVKAEGSVFPRLGIDWIGTVCIAGEIPPENVAALLKLFEHGVEVCALLWCVEEVGQSYLNNAEQMLPFMENFATFAWTHTRTGDDGKVFHWTEWACDAIIEKGEDICKEALSQGLHVFPAQVGEQQHQWFTEMGHTPMANFAQAVDSFLELYG